MGFSRWDILTTLKDPNEIRKIQLADPNEVRKVQLADPSEERIVRPKRFGTIQRFLTFTNIRLVTAGSSGFVVFSVTPTIANPVLSQFVLEYRNLSCSYLKTYLEFYVGGVWYKIESSEQAPIENMTSLLSNLTDTGGNSSGILDKPFQQLTFPMRIELLAMNRSTADEQRIRITLEDEIPLDGIRLTADNIDTVDHEIRYSYYALFRSDG